jgi:hypothetical protein
VRLDKESFAKCREMLAHHIKKSGQDEQGKNELENP